MRTVKDLIAHLERHDRPDAVIAVAIWHPDDVKARAKDRGVNIGDDLAEAVIAHMADNHDATLGFTWSTVDFWLDELLTPSD